MSASAPFATRQALKTPRAAAIAGIIFSLLLAFSQVLIRLAIPATPQEASAWRTDPTHKTLLGLGLSLVPFAGIAFLWFLGVVRDRLGAQEDRFFATVLLGSGLLFVAMLYVAAALAGGMFAAGATGTGTASFANLWQFGQSLTLTITTTYAMRMAGVFMIATSTITLRTAFMPRWLGYLGYALAVVLLVAASSVRWVELAFPVWVLLVSGRVLVESLRAPAEPQKLPHRRL
jgi:hypothetical protein